MNIQKQTIPTTNYEVGRRGTSVKKIIIHWMDGTLASADAQFKKLNSTSAHYGVEDDVVYQWVNLSDTAYHAGNFSVNLESIGIEHSADPNRPASDKTYETSAQIIANVSLAYNIPLDRAHVLRHGEIVATQCCGTVNVDRLIKRALEINSQITMPPELSKYRIDWKEIAVSKGLDVNSSMFTDYRNIDKIISDRVNSVTSSKDQQIKSLIDERDKLKQLLADANSSANKYAEVGKLTVDLVKKAQSV